MQQTDTCLTCGGLIVYSQQPLQYSGPMCHCKAPPRVQRPSRMEQGRSMEIQLNQAERHAANLKAKNEKALAALKHVLMDEEEGGCVTSYTRQLCEDAVKALS